MSEGIGSRVDLHLPDEMLSVMPTDPYEQLDLARKITSMAVGSGVSKLESEMGRMRLILYEKDKVIFELQEKASSLNCACQEAQTKLKNALDENAKLSKERDQLMTSTKKLNRDLSKLEMFKRQLMKSLNDDTSSTAETVDIRTFEQPVPKAYPDKDEGANDYVVHHSYNRSSNIRSTTDEDSRHDGYRFSLTPYITPRLTPTGTPKIISTAGSPKHTSGTTSPIKLPYDGQTFLSSWFPSSQQSSASNSPPHMRSLPGRPPRIEGKEFFRQVRTRLPYEQFSAFLINVKELNAQKQTREETLQKAEEIFGTDNEDLYLSFQQLLTRNIH